MKAKTIVVIATVLAVLGCAKQRDRSVAAADGDDGAASGAERKRAVVVESAPPVGPVLAGLAVNDAGAQPLSIEGRSYEYVVTLPPDGHDASLDTEAYDAVEEPGFADPRVAPLSTFSIDVDTASYANVRRFLREGRMPPAGAVRIEELVNYFRYDDPAPRGDAPFGVGAEIAEAPWNPRHRLVRIGIRGMDVAPEDRPPASLVFLLDVSGSMRTPNKLPLVKSAMKMLLDTLDGDDRVAVVVYAGAAGLALPSTPASDRATILEAVEALEAGGSTAGGAGIRLAYDTARDAFVSGGINRVVLCTDGDFNVGITNQSDLVELIEGEAADGVFLTVLGFGMGNYKDSTLEKLADRGNGNYGYIDSRHEARKMLVEQVGATLVTIAKDVKIQVELNPAAVAAYRLIGYENRRLRAEDFHDDTKDAGEIGAGHSVTALYEIVPVGVAIDLPPVDDLKYRTPSEPSEAAAGGELMTVKIRYKAPDADTSRLLDFAVADEGGTLASASDDLRFSAAVAGFGMRLRGSRFVGDDWGLADAAELARASLGADPGGHRGGFVELVETARRLGLDGSDEITTSRR